MWSASACTATTRSVLVVGAIMSAIMCALIMDRRRGAATRGLLVASLLGL
jgi:hypothetical protein